MAQLTHTIGGVAFNALGPTEARVSLGCFPSHPEYMLTVYHPPGATGNIVCWGGAKGGTITHKARYLGALADVMANYKADLAAWSGQSVTIVDSAGTTFERCILNPDSATMSAPRGMGAKCIMDATATFMRHGG